ncbi:hypothetical protein MMC32_002249 [Xylographa parallela]|nr:hypothetical protein [Xylographa parallela]
MGNGKRDVQGNKSFAARKVSRDKHRRRVKTPTEILTAMHLGLPAKARFPKILPRSFGPATPPRLSTIALRGGLAFGDEGPWRLLTEVEMVEEDKKLAAEVAAATAAGAEMLKMWVNMFGGGSEPPAMVVAEEMEAAAGLDMMESEEENDEEDEEEDDDNDYNEEGDRRAAGPVRPYEITKLPFRSRPAQ